MLMIYISMLETEEDKDIFIQLHDEYSGVMFKRAYSILRDTALAEDVVQESFIRILKILKKLRRKSVHKRGNISLI